MKTAADEHLKSAERCLQESIGHLNEILLSKCQGYSEYRIEYTAALHEALVYMIRARQQLSLYEK
jgi:hypothetical protein